MRWRVLLILSLVIQQAMLLPGGLAPLAGECEAAAETGCCMMPSPDEAASCCGAASACRCDHQPEERPALPTRSQSADQYFAVRPALVTILAEPTPPNTSIPPQATTRPHRSAKDVHCLLCVWRT